MKRSSVLSLCAAIAAAVGFLASCNNPFTSDMGERVVIGDARISLLTPDAASILSGSEARISGEAWAHRELRRIEVRITWSVEDELANSVPKELPWTAIPDAGIERRLVPAAGVYANWWFDFDTRDFPDGIIHVHFRAIDNVGSSETLDLVYTVKNDPSAVRLSFPRPENIDVAGGAQIRGDVVDLRGLQPGYPMIQIWPRRCAAEYRDFSDSDEPVCQCPDPPVGIITPPPSGDDLEWGWVSMFLFSPGSYPQIHDDWQTGVYEPRYHVPFSEHPADDPYDEGYSEAVPITVNFANFTFGLNRFTIEQRDDGVRMAVLELDNWGNPSSLPSGYYYFRIRTRDTAGIEGYFPPLNEAAIVLRVRDNLDPPTLYIDNSDIDPERLEESPNIYITGVNSRIIAIDDDPGPYARPDRDFFRLRVVGRHVNGVHRATLRWNHPATGNYGDLELDADAGGESGSPVDSERRAFTFTAGEAHRDIFVTHAGGYTLTLRVYIRATDQGGNDIFAEKAFNLFMDGEGPTVEIRQSVRGAVGPPRGDARERHGGLVNVNPITVNGNVQASGNSSAAFSIMRDAGRDRDSIKWVLEPAGAVDLDNPLAGDTMLANLVRFRKDPSHQNLGFFRGISETRYSGWVSGPASNFSFNFNATNALEDTGGTGEYLWLYVIAMDGVSNLGFAMQKIRVDESTDVPNVDLPGLFADNASGTRISGPESLMVNVNDNQQPIPGMNWAAGSPRRNILSRNQGVELVLSDDDGIYWTRDANARTIDCDGPACNAPAVDCDCCECDIRIILTDLNLDPPRPVRIPHWEVEPLSDNPRELMATLSQRVLGEAMGHGSHLRDGFYRIEITVRDNARFKVLIDGDPGPTRSRSETYYFAVHTDPPNITVMLPAFDSFNHVYPEPVQITGTVESRFPVRRLWITFDPHVLSSQGPAEYYSRELDLTPVDGDDGMYVYVYTWTMDDAYFNPDFNPDNGTEADSEQRRFSLRAFDALAYDASAPHRIRIDATPPTVGLLSFNQLRPQVGGAHRVWGNVHFRVNVTDTHRLSRAEDQDGNWRLGIWWLLLPEDADLPNRDTIQEQIQTGTGGQFYFIETFYPNDPARRTDGHTLPLHNVVLDAVFYSGDLDRDTTYKLIVIATDEAGNWNYGLGQNPVLVSGIRLDRELDYPALVAGRLEPTTPPGAPLNVLGTDHAGDLRIRGLARDTDGFLRDRADRYVEVRFSTDPDRWDAGDWIEIDDAYLDPTGAVGFRFPFFSYHDSGDDEMPAWLRGVFHDNMPDWLREYFRAPDHRRITVRYQIRVTDERSFALSESGDAVTTLADPLTTRNKNPQLGFMPRFGKTHTSYPHHALDIVDSVYRVFPAEDPGDPRESYFEFVFDNRPPEIEFGVAFATPAPTFRNVDDLMAALRGTIREANPHSFHVSLPPAEPVVMEFGDGGLPQVTPGTPGHYRWDLEDAREDIENMWRGLPPGTRNVLLVAEDRAGNMSRVNWPFIKDVQGPGISFTNIGRAIDHAAAPGSFPNNWPRDWPHGDAWRADETWSPEFRAAIADWPSDFALLSAAAVSARIDIERGRVPTVVTERSLEGDFDDMHGFIFDLHPDPEDPSADHLFALYFYYRINSGIGRGNLPPSDTTAGWRPVRVERAAGQSLSSSGWAIPLPAGLADGGHTLDIKARDNAGNWTEIYGARFTLDTQDPEFMAYSGGNWATGASPDDNFFTANWDSTSTFRPMAQHERVFSAGDAAEEDYTVFELRGRVLDVNLRNLTARLGSEGVDLLTAFAAAAGGSGSVDTDGFGNNSDAQNRLFISRYAGATWNDASDEWEIPSGSAALPDNVWEWTFRVLERDIYDLQNQAGTNAGTRRVVSMIATDYANNRSDLMQWAFNLDGEGPSIEILNLDLAVAPANPGEQIPAGIRNVFVPVTTGAGNNAVTTGPAITGIASDDTGIKTVMFTAARWDYEAGDWLWLSGATGSSFAPGGADWLASGNLTAAGIANAHWRDLRDGVTESRPTVEWTIPDLFAEEGRYMVFVRATDWSLAMGDSSAGNPSVSGSYRPGDPNPVRAPVPGGFSHHFFVDRGPPAIAWVDGDRQFFNDDALRGVGFAFTVIDPNTVTYVRAEIRRDGDPPAAPPVLTVPFGDINIGGGDHDTVSRTATLRPDMTGIAPVEGREQYALMLIVQDSAGNQTYINHTRTFFRDNTPPVLRLRSVITRPAQTIDEETTADGETYIRDINVGLAGNVTIRGTTDAGISPMPAGGVRYALLLTGQNVDDPEVQWRYETAAPNSGRQLQWMSGDVEIMRMEQNPSLVWTIEIPNTRNISNLPATAGFVRRHTAVDDVTDPDTQVLRTDIRFDDEPLPLNGIVYLARLAVQATDESGNLNREVFDLWIFPEGDRPGVEILSPMADLAGRGGNLLSGRFTLTGRAWDNEHIYAVFFRVRRVANPDTTNDLGDPFDNLVIPRFRLSAAGEWETVPGQTQTAMWINQSRGTVWSGANPPDPIADPGYTPGWFQASGGGRRDVVWSVPINACGRLNAPGAGGSNPVAIEVMAQDATRVADNDPSNASGWRWSTAGAMISGVGNRSTTHAFVVSGAPEFENIRMSLTDARGVRRVNLPAEELHIGRQATLVDLMFDVSVVDGRQVSAIRFQQSDDTAPFAGTGPMIDLLNADGTGRTVTAGLGNGITSISVTGLPEATTRTVTVRVNPVELADMAGSGRFPLHVTASDNSSPALTARAADLYLHIDDSPPFARVEFNPSIAGTSATLGGSASPWPGDVNSEAVGRVDSVIVWFERIRGAAGAERRIPWNRDAVAGDTAPDSETGFTAFRGRWVSVSNAAAWATATGTTIPPEHSGRIQLPRIPAPNAEGVHATAGGDFAIVIDRNDPMGTQAAQHGQRLVTGWTAGGLHQQWSFTFDSTRLPSGPLDMHFVVFDRAGNATWAKQRIVVMNNAPLILDVQIATDIRGDGALNTALNTATGGAGTANLARPGSVIFNAIRGVFTPANINFGSPSPEEQDIRRGISPPRSPRSQAGLFGLGLVQDTIRPGDGSRPPPQEGVAGDGARFHFADFTTRNNFLALGIQTVQPPGDVPGRSFRVEYVRPDANLTNARQITAGNAYIIENSPPGMDWSAVGTLRTAGSGYVFVAVAAGSTLPFTDAELAAATVRRLVPQTGAASVGDQLFDNLASDAARDAAVRAEFVFRGAETFGTGANQIRDYDSSGTDTDRPAWRDRYALFLVSVFDGLREDLFGDFTLISVRVNNDDQTRPFAQLYDLNPAAVNSSAATPDAAASDVQAVIRPTTIDGTQNRVLGGLWRNNHAGNLSRPGNIEPRNIPSLIGFHAAHQSHAHSLTPAQMGQIAGERETVNSAAFFAVDTVSGRVILRGYAEDDQRISEVRLFFTEVGNGLSDDFAILESPTTLGSQTISPVPQTGLLRVPPVGTPNHDPNVAGNVFFTDTIDLYRHRVEWAFVWDTANVPANFVAGNLTVRVQASNYRPEGTALTSPEINAADNRAMATERGGATLRADWRMRNFGFPANLPVHNEIRINVRPYITGFRRNTNFNDTRSLQGRRAFYRGGVAEQASETVVVTGFNLGGTGTTNISLPRVSGGSIEASEVTAAGFGLPASPSASHFRQFTVPQNAVTSDGIVRLNVVLPEETRPGNDAARTFPAVNTGSERPVNVTGTGGIRNGNWWVQPWNVERSASAGERSNLWDNVTRVHIWQSNDDRTDGGRNQGSFPATRSGWEGSLFGTSMSIDPRTGTLWASHNEAGGLGVLGTVAVAANNTGMTIRSTNELVSRDINVRPGGTGAANQRIEENAGFAEAPFRIVTGWADPVMHSSIAVDESGTPWVVSSLIGITGGGARNTWRHLGGLWVHGPGGSRVNFEAATPPVDTTSAARAGSWANDSLHHVESGWFNGSEGGIANDGWTGTWSPATGSHGQLDQFRNPRLVTFTSGAITYTHVAYFDVKDGSIKYRFIHGGGMSQDEAYRHGMWGWDATPATHTPNTVLRGWVNLDGGFDADDTVALPSVFPFTNEVADFTVAGTGVPADARVVNHGTRDAQNHPNNTGAAESRTRGSIIAGEHNDIAVTSQGHPVIVYFDATNNRLRMAISNSRTPFVASAWHIVTDVLDGDPRSFGTGQYVSIAIDTRYTFASATADTPTANGAWNVVHISAWNDNFNSLVYIRGRVNSATRNWSFEKARLIDSAGSVGRRSNISLDVHGNPWIAYLDGSLVGGREGVKVAFLNRNADGDDQHEFGRRQLDYLGDEMTGWETMHVPARFPVVDHQDLVQTSQLGMENWPTRNFTGQTTPPANDRWWRGAVGFLSNDLFRIAYWVE